MRSSFSIPLPESPELAIQRLEAFGREWRTSKLPESVRAKGYTTSEVRRRGERIIVRLGPTGRGPAYVLDAQLVAAGGVSQLRAEVREAGWSRVMVSAFPAVAALGLVWETTSDLDGGRSSWLPLTVMLGLMIGLRAVLARAGQTNMVPKFRLNSRGDGYHKCPGAWLTLWVTPG